MSVEHRWTFSDVLRTDCGPLSQASRVVDGESYAADIATDGVTIARLCGRSRRLAITGAEIEAAVVELVGVTASPVLLGRAAGTYMAAHRADPALNPFARRAADLLLAAGGDLGEAEAEAARVAARTASRRSAG